MASISYFPSSSSSALAFHIFLLALSFLHYDSNGQALTPIKFHSLSIRACLQAAKTLPYSTHPSFLVPAPSGIKTKISPAPAPSPLPEFDTLRSSDSTTSSQDSESAVSSLLQPEMRAWTPLTQKQKDTMTKLGVQIIRSMPRKLKVYKMEDECQP